MLDRDLHDRRAWLARIDGRGGEPVGAAFAIDDRHLVTCAHVVVAAGASGPGATVAVSFPLLGVTVVGEVLAEGWSPLPPGRGTTGDTAIVALADPPDGLEAAPLLERRALHGQDFLTEGFADGYDEGIPIDGTIGRPVGREWVKLDAGWTRSASEGFSGSAVWTGDAEAVVAMVARRDASPGGSEAFAIPVRVLAGRSRIVRRALLTPLDLDPDREIHWGPRSRGVDSDRDDAGWLFSGRRAALTELTRWLESEGGRPMRVVTGTPGCGKSAVVARLVTTADPHYRARIPGLDIEDPTVPSLGTIDVTFHAGGRTVADFVEHVARVADVDATTDRELLAAFEAEGRRRVVAVDALDESEEAKHLVWLLDDLTRGPTRILVATRSHLVADLVDPEPIVLDEAPYLQPRDIEDYVRQLLSRSGPVAYTDADVEDLVAAADGNFLVAQLTARAIGLTGSVVRPFPREVRRAFGRYLDALPEPEKTRDLLLPLAYGRGDGLPTDLWLAAVACLRKPYARSELDDLLDSPGGSFLVTRTDAAGGGRRHRLFHAVLAETLTARRDQDEDRARLWQAWLDLLHETDTTGAAWLSAPHYLRIHGADHAAQAGHLPELLDAPHHLLVADLDRLGINLAGAPGSLVLDRHAALLRLAADRSARQGPEARSMTLGLAACHLGLPQTAAELAVAGRPPWIPLWAHDFGHPHERLVGHRHPVSAVALGRLGGQDRIVSGDSGGDVLVWDPESRSHDGVIRPLTVGVHDIRIGRLDRRNVIVAIDANGVTRTWAGTGSELRRRRPEERTIGDIKFTIDRSRFVGLGTDRGHEVVVTVAHDGELRVRRVATGRQVIGVRARRQRRSATVGRLGDDPWWSAAAPGEPRPGTSRHRYRPHSGRPRCGRTRRLR